MSFDYEACRTKLSALVREMGAQIRPHAGQHDARLHDKDGGCEAERIVTIADVIGSALARDRLQEWFPDIALYDEESVDAGCCIIPDMLPDRYFLVDPLDGTAEFDSNGQYYGVQMCLIEKGRPVVAAIYLPAVDVLYSAQVNRDGVMYESAGRQDIILPAHFRPQKDAYLTYNSRWSDETRVASVAGSFQDAVKASGINLHVLCMRELDKLLPDMRLGHQMESPLLPWFNSVAVWSARGSLWDVGPWDLCLEKLDGCLLTHDGQRVAYGRSRAYYTDKPFRVSPIVMLPAPLKNLWTPVPPSAK